MTRPEAKGWCPGAYRPMMSGDGLVVRVRPEFARLDRDQVMGLCAAAKAFGSGVIDLTSRANLQIRGVSEARHEPLLQELDALGLLNDDPELESRRNILMPPLWEKSDDSYRIAKDLMARLGDLPALPAKVGYAVDAGPAPVMQQNSADFRIERDTEGGLILRADGASAGRSVTVETAVDAILEMADWFVATGGTANRRMAAHLSHRALPAEWQTHAPAPATARLVPGQTPVGPVFGVAFGQIDATALERLLRATKAEGLRVTPWRLFLLENASGEATEGFITDANDPLLLADACPGAPLCTAASVETRSIARQLAQHIKGPLHISGCAKGCARPRKCRTTLVGRNGKFDLVRDGLPWDEPLLTGLAPDTLPHSIGDH